MTHTRRCSHMERRVAWGSVGGAAWRRRRGRRRRERTGAEAGRMLRGAWVRLFHDAGAAQGTWRRGADTVVVQAA